MSITRMEGPTPVYGPPANSFITKMVSGEAAIEESNDIDWDEYIRQVKESDGFYVDPKTSNNYDCAITPTRFNPKDETDLCVRLAKLAVHTFNQRVSKETHGELEFVTLLNATEEAVHGFLYYLTFEAMNLDKGITCTYQAIVWKYVNDIVVAFRLKPTPGSAKTWFWREHKCGEKEYAEGVLKVPEPISYEVIFKCVVNAEDSCAIIDDCLLKNINVFTGAHYRLLDSESDPSKKIIQLSGTVEQVEKAWPMVCESIMSLKSY